MADSAASTQSQPRRAASRKRRQAAISTDTENKLARAARSAQRLAQLSDMSRDDSTLDLFPDDPTRATLEAMNIDVRQGTLHGFELPDVVLAAVGAVDADGVPLETKAARRAPRAVKSDEPAPVNGQLIGLEIDETALSQAKFAERTSDDEAARASTREVAGPLTSAMAAASVARSVTALRKAAERSPNEDVVPASSSGGAKPAVPSQRFAATFVKASTAAREAATTQTAHAESALSADVAASSADATAAGKASGEASAVSAAVPPPTSPASANSSLNAAASRETQRAEAAAAALRAATPELDRARATAFADTVDAMYGVISDQRRAATDHSRRMKWMLSIVVGALLVTVAIGMTQTLLLMRLTRETAAQQHRIEQLMQNQQAAMTNLLDAHSAAANAAAAAAAASSAAPATADPQQTAATAHAGRAARTHRPHKSALPSAH